MIRRSQPKFQNEWLGGRETNDFLPPLVTVAYDGWLQALIFAPVAATKTPRRTANDIRIWHSLTRYCHNEAANMR